MLDKLKNHPKIILGIFVLLVAISIALVSLVNRSERTAYVPGKTSAVGPWTCSDSFTVETVASPTPTPTPTPTPSISSVLTIVDVFPAAVYLSWTAIPGTSSYNLYRCSGDSSCLPTQLVSTTSNLYTGNAVSPDTTYRYQVVSVNNPSAVSNIVTLTTPATAIFSLSSVTISGQTVSVVYSKNFLSCTDLLLSTGILASSPSSYCEMGNNIQKDLPFSSFTGVTPGALVKLCQTNNYGACSNSVSVLPLTIPTPTPTPSPSISPSPTPSVSPTPTPSSNPNTSPSPSASPTNIASLLLQVGLEAVTTQRANQQMNVAIKDSTTNTVLMPPQIKTFTSGISGLYSNFNSQITGIPLTSDGTAPQVVTICITSPSYLTNCYANKFLYPGSNTIDVSTDFLLAGDAINAGSSSNVVDYFDFNNIFNNFGCTESSGATPPPNKSCNSFKSDLDFDGDIDLYDYNFMMGNYGTAGDQ